MACCASADDRQDQSKQLKEGIVEDGSLTEGKPTGENQSVPIEESSMQEVAEDGTQTDNPKSARGNTPKNKENTENKDKKEKEGKKSKKKKEPESEPVDSQI